MVVKCVACGEMWLKQVDKDWGPDVSTGSLCTGCFVETLIETIRRNQLCGGNFDCFKRAEEGYCDQLSCKYRKWCL